MCAGSGVENLAWHQRKGPTFWWGLAAAKAVDITDSGNVK